jgi:predicted Fe-Mo cluster-binding NifX family protein
VITKYQGDKKMKIAISAATDLIDGGLDLRFGRAKFFLIYDLENDDYKFISNQQNVMAKQGAGVQSGQRVLQEGVKAVVSGHFGPKAFKVLNSSKIDIYTSGAKPLKDVVRDFKVESLSKLSNADVEGHW